MIPDRLLRPLTASRSAETINPDGTIDTEWETVEFLGRITRRTADETGEQGRQAAVDTAKLMTNEQVVRFDDRIIDDAPVLSDDVVSDVDDEQWEVWGQPVAVWAASAVHHYETPIRRVTG